VSGEAAAGEAGDVAAELDPRAIDQGVPRGRLTHEKSAEPSGAQDYDAVVVEATPAQIERALQELHGDHRNYLGLEVQSNALLPKRQQLWADRYGRPHPAPAARPAPEGGTARVGEVPPQSTADAPLRAPALSPQIKTPKETIEAGRAFRVQLEPSRLRGGRGGGDATTQSFAARPAPTRLAGPERSEKNEGEQQGHQPQPSAKASALARSETPGEQIRALFLLRYLEPPAPADAAPSEPANRQPP
jgi:hypothetical protein